MSLSVRVAQWACWTWLAAQAADRVEPDSLAVAIDRAAAALAAGSTTASQLLGDATLMSLHSDPRFRDLVRVNAPLASVTLVSNDEAGIPLVVSGTVRDAHGKPLAGALLCVLHTDAQGRYTIARAMDEAHARLFGYVRTGADGRYEIRTIRPGPYPKPVTAGNLQRRIPEHVHFEISMPAHADIRSQLYFEDDPLMQQPWARPNAERHHFPIVSVTRDSAGTLRCTCDWSLADQ